MEYVGYSKSYMNFNFFTNVLIRYVKRIVNSIHIIYMTRTVQLLLHPAAAICHLKLNKTKFIYEIIFFLLNI